MHSTNQKFINNGFLSRGYRNFIPRDAYEECLQGAILVDVRERNLIGYKRFDVPQIMYVPLSELDERKNELPYDKPLIFADSAGLRSSEAMFLLLNAHTTGNIANLAGGIVEWEHDGLPLVTNIKEQLDGSCMCQLRPRHKNK